MTIKLTPTLMALAYDLLNETEPFKGYNLPDSDEVKFIVARFSSDFARYQWDGSHHTIFMSKNAIGHLSTLLEKTAHEMIHMHLEETGAESRSVGKDTHNGAFRICAMQVCKAHGWDYKAFF